MKRNQARTLRAFSLIELSIVILIIGVLVAGVTQGSALIKKAALSKAKDLTIRSEVGNIKGLVVWLETSLPDAVSIDANDKVTKWNDLNPSRPGGLNAVPIGTSNAPLYLKEGINGLPTISFTSSSSQYLFWGDTNGDGLKVLVNKNYSIFVVEKRGMTNVNVFMGGTSTTSYQNLHFGYRANTTMTQDHYFSGLDCTVPSFGASNRSAVIHTALFSSSSVTLEAGGTFIGLKYMMNGGDKASCADITKVQPLTAYPGATIGKHLTAYYTGYISEIIIYTRYLKASERRAVESYLGKKYSIPVKPS